MEWSQFLGRFHPLVVHLPIGFLVFGALLETLNFFLPKRYSGLNQAILLSYLASAVGAILSAGIGLLLAQGGGYEGSTLVWHKWLGIGLIVASFGAWWLKSSNKLPVKYSFFTSIGLLIWVSVTGHLGGNLTHGSDYLLEYAPQPIQKLMGMQTDLNKTDALPGSVDSIMVYHHLIKPALDDKCTSCHNPDKAKGGLDLSTQEAMMKGGNSGAVISKSNAQNSELMIRVTLPNSSKKYMPTSGQPLNFTEIELLKYWIDQGADFNFTLSDQELPEHLQKLLLRDYKIDTSPKSFLEKLTVASLDEEAMKSAVAHGIRVERLSAQSNLLEVNVNSGVFSEEEIQLLQPLKQNIVQLSMKKSNISQEGLQFISGLHNLTYLDVSNTNFQDADVNVLLDLKNLEVLNLYGTAIGLQTAESLLDFPNLKRVYLWQTNLEAESIAKLKTDHENIEFIGGEG